jgi:hypothetical protein
MKQEIDIEHELEELGKYDKLSLIVAYQDIIGKVERIQKERAPKSLVISAILCLLVAVSANALLTHQKAKNTKHQSDTLATAYALGIMSNHSIYGELYE